MSLLARFRTETLFTSDNSGSGHHEEESGLSTNGQSSFEDIYNPAEMMPSQPSTRSSSTLAEPFSPRTQRIIKISGNTVCQKLELPDGSLDEFTKLPDLASMFVYIAGKLMKNELVDAQQKADTLIESQDYRTILSEILLTLLLSPNLTAYRTGLASHVIDFIKKNLEIFKIPGIVYEDPVLRHKYCSLVKDLLTQGRSQIKTKLIKGIMGKAHLGDLARSIAPKGIELTPEHLCRIAFLRIMLCHAVASSLDEQVIDGEWLAAHLDEVVKAVEEADTKDFWQKVDEELQALRDLEKTGEEADIVVQYFTVMLQQDMKYFPNAAGSNVPKPTLGLGPNWQKVIDRTIAFNA